jgi:hypothetical protein
MTDSPKSQRLGMTVATLSILIALAAIGGPSIVGLGRHKPIQIVTAKRTYPTVNVQLDPKVVDQILKGVNANTQAQLRAFLDMQSTSITAALAEADKRADAAQAQADKWQQEVAVYHAQQQRDADDKKTRTIMMIILTAATAALVIFALTAKTTPDWAKETAKVAAGAVFAAWFK